MPAIGDLGYQGTTVIRPRRKRPGHKEHTPADQVWNWKILATGYRGRLTELANIIRTVTTLECYRLNW